jgi:hypothetical protein
MARLLAGDTEVLNELILSSVRVQNRISTNQIRADSLQHWLNVNGINERGLGIRRHHELASRRVEMHRQIESLRLKRDLDLPHDRSNLKTQIRERRVRLHALSPVETVGKISVTDRPIRPRRLRAMAILTLLGALAGLVLAFTWDYISRHRSEIFRG